MLKSIKSLSFLSLFLIFTDAQANIIVDTSLWTLAESPARGGSQGITSANGNQAIQNNNANGALISDFIFDGDFVFSGFMTPTSDLFDDDDILGVVFGWQDERNHYRLGWEQGGLNDRGDRADGRYAVSSGMFLVKEVDGVSSTLFEQELFWQDDVNYRFSVARAGEQISFSLGGVEQSFIDNNFTRGHVGFYTESQTARFASLTGSSTSAQIPEPDTLALLGLVLLGVAVRKSRR
ncbi:PEP-CTERM sorting domain-containing protein [Thalassotalea euphylliae]|uniref:PEP-CTERM sorting domain-containing protein n=1 Tax=Thalassotalea euphylliae TaxID=1655234 RepID=A0A3E0TV63_9GAMM|nr:PEP-CTERM sorting domain-containing protein [Thalassotalea euphylliae]REL28253.1 PEP-CTERM sorting domain-containing protein [Thalassotalea euphylliae]